MQRETIKILADIIKKEMNLQDTQIWIYNQNFRIQNKPDEFIVIAYVNSKSYAINNKFKSDINTENINLNSIETYRISILSKNNQARLRKEEIIMALNSVFCHQMQDKYYFRISNTENNFTDASAAEGPAIQTRYDLFIKIQSHYNKSKTVDYYNVFPYTIIKEN